MNNDIHTLYYNNFGIAFQWKRCATKYLNKIQLVFRNTGVFLNQEELLILYVNTEKALEKCFSHMNCSEDTTERLLLLEAPNPQISFAMSA